MPVQPRVLHGQGVVDRRPRRRLRHRRRRHVVRRVHVPQSRCRDRTRRIDHDRVPGQRHPEQQLAPRVQRRWRGVATRGVRCTTRRSSPAGATRSGAMRVRGVVRPSATEMIHVGIAFLLCPGDTSEGRVVLTSQTVGTETFNWSVMLPVSETADVRWHARDRPGRIRRRVQHPSRKCNPCAPVHDGRCAGRRLGRGWRRHDAGRIRSHRRVRGAGRRSRRRRERHLVRVTGDDAAGRPPVVERRRRFDVPEGVDPDGRRTDRRPTSPVRPTVACWSPPRPRRAGALRRFEGGSVSALAPLTPGRLMDTREGQLTVDGQFAGIGVRAANSITELQVGGRGGVPADAAAVVLNVTVTGAQGSGFITVFPCGEALPTASNLNFKSR